MSSRDDDRISYLEGEDTGPLSAAERAELDRLRGHLEADATWVEPDPGLEDRVVAAVAQESAITRGSREQHPSGARRQRRALADRLGVRAPAFALGALAAALVAVVIALAGGSGAAAPEFAATVTGTGLAPAAQGGATFTKTTSGWRIQLSASGLRRLANGRYYQAWLKSPAGVLVPIGTFNDARKVTLWAGVTPGSFPVLTVTRQRADGNQESSGERVLLGTIRAER